MSQRAGTHSALALGSEGVLRPGGWRWLRALAWMLLCLAVLGGILSLQSVARAIDPNPSLVLTMAFACTLLAYLTYAGLVRWGERRMPAELGLSRLPLDLLLGFLTGALAFSLVFGVLWLSGAYLVTAGNWTDWPHDIREAIGTGLLEELLARLVIFRLLARAFGIRWALALSAVAFGAAHLGNAHASPFAALAIAIEAGLMLAGFYLLTGRIWMSVGVHAAWNFTQGAIFGARVSGMEDSGSLLVSMPVTEVSPIWSGGAFGPEASLPAIVVGLLLFLATLTLIHRRQLRSGSGS